MLIEKIAKIKTESVPPRLYYKVISFWQRQLKIHNDFTFSMEEKKCEVSTRELVAKFAQCNEAVEYLTTTDPSKKLLREERMHIVPILTKYSPDSQLIDRLQASLVDDLTYCRVQHEKVGELSTLIYFIERTGCS